MIFSCDCPVFFTRIPRIRVLKAHYFPGGNLNITRLPLRPTDSLVHMNGSIGQRKPFALGPGAEKHRTHTGGHTNAYGGNIRANQLHGIVNRQPGTDKAPGLLM